MKNVTALATIALLLFPAAAFAGVKPMAKPTPTVYACATCHMKFTAAQAKKDHFKDPMDGGMLTPVKSASKKTMMPKTMDM